MKLDAEINNKQSFNDLVGSRNSKVNKVVYSSKPQDSTKKDELFPFSTILDLGMEWTIISGPAWSTVKKYNNSLSMYAVYNAMSAAIMNLCDAVMAIQNDDVQVRLFGVRKGIHTPMLTNDEAVVNNHFIWEVGWQSDCAAKRQGGSQR
eukprot:14544382-Ditylum_brightwellii.AAC.1